MSIEKDVKSSSLITICSEQELTEINGGNAVKLFVDYVVKVAKPSNSDKK